MCCLRMHHCALLVYLVPCPFFKLKRKKCVCFLHRILLGPQQVIVTFWMNEWIEWILCPFGGLRSSKGNLVLGPQHCCILGGREERPGSGSCPTQPPSFTRKPCFRSSGKASAHQAVNTVFFPQCSGLVVACFGTIMIYFTASEFLVSYRMKAGSPQIFRRRWFLSSFKVKGKGQKFKDLVPGM